MPRDGALSPRAGARRPWFLPPTAGSHQAAARRSRSARLAGAGEAPASSGPAPGVPLGGCGRHHGSAHAGTLSRPGGRDRLLRCQVSGLPLIVVLGVKQVQVGRARDAYHRALSVLAICR